MVMPVFISACQIQERSPVPVINAPNREETDIPPDGIVPVAGIPSIP